MYGAYTFGDQRPQHSSGVLPQTFPKKMKRIAKGIIFDMDGTLTKAVINFTQMRQRANILEGTAQDEN